jgi:hypothetical protein
LAYLTVLITKVPVAAQIHGARNPRCISYFLPEFGARSLERALQVFIRKHLNLPEKQETITQRRANAVPRRDRRVNYVSSTRQELVRVCRINLRQAS